MKAILVVDLPNNVNMDRVIQTPVTLSFDLGGIKQLMFADGYLKPMPQKKEETFAYWIARGCNDPESYINGWNACLKEITE